jgi:hypothetical protein
MLDEVKTVLTGSVHLEHLYMTDRSAMQHARVFIYTPLLRLMRVYERFNKKNFHVE